MKVSIMYLRKLGKYRRKTLYMANTIEEESSRDGNSSHKRWSLEMMLSNEDSPINLNAEEQEYIDITKEFR